MKLFKHTIAAFALSILSINAIQAQSCNPSACAAKKNGLGINASQVTKTTILHKSASDVWTLLAKVDGIERIVPTLVKSSKINNNQKAEAGCSRTCVSPEGNVFVEKITELNHKTMFMAYSIESGIPAKMTNSFQVISLGKNSCKVIWSSHYDFIPNDQMTESQFNAFMDSAGQTIVDGLKNLYS